jgi:hypothetical protein
MHCCFVYYVTLHVEKERFFATLDFFFANINNDGGGGLGDRRSARTALSATAAL